MAYRGNTSPYTPHRKKGKWSDTYLTPPTLIEALGPFTLDPACPAVMPWRTARRMIHHPRGDGLREAWYGFVWLNPPFGAGLKAFAEKMVAHDNGIILLNGRSTETRVTQACFAGASAVFFPARRLMFHDRKGKRMGAWFPSLLVGFGPTAAERLAYLSTKPREEHGGTRYVSTEEEAMMDWLLIVIGLQVPTTMIMTTYPQCLAVVTMLQAQAGRTPAGRRAICVGPKGEVVTEVQLRGRPT